MNCFPATNLFTVTCRFSVVYYSIHCVVLLLHWQISTDFCKEHTKKCNLCQVNFVLYAVLLPRIWWLTCHFKHSYPSLAVFWISAVASESKQATAVFYTCHFFQFVMPTLIGILCYVFQCNMVVINKHDCQSNKLCLQNEQYVQKLQTVRVGGGNE